MKNFVRLGSSALVIGLAGLLVGCTSYPKEITQRTRLAHDFEVVETSTKRSLNDKEMAVLRAKVAEYLDKQGATSSGNYYVKVYLGADQEGVPAEWVIVRFSRDMDMRFQLLGSDDSYYPSYRSYASYDVYPYGYDNFGRISFQYYDEPYYGGGYYIPPQWRDNHDRNRNHDGDHDRRKDRDHDGDRNRSDDHPRPQDHARHAPQPPGGTPQVTHTRWDGDSSGQNNPSHENGGSRHGGTSVRPQPDHSNERSYTPPVRTSSQSAPSYNPPAARSESRPSSNSDNGPKESSRAGNSYEKQE